MNRRSLPHLAQAKIWRFKPGTELAVSIRWSLSCPPQRSHWDEGGGSTILRMDLPPDEKRCAGVFWPVIWAG
jgi:hypothetical protein